MKKTTVWEFTHEELEVLDAALFHYGNALVADDEVQWNPGDYEIADDLRVSFSGELHG